MKVHKNILAIVIMFCFLFTLTGCNQSETGGNKTHDKSDTEFENDVVMVINGMDITSDLFTIILYEAAFNFRNNIEIPEGLSEEEYDDWVLNFWNKPIDGTMPLDIVKDLAIEDAKKYVCSKIKCKESGFEINDEERTDLETRIMQDIGIEYDPDNLDSYFKSTYGVTRDTYLKYKVDNEIFFLNAVEIMKDIEIPEKQIEDYYNNYKDYFSDRTVRSIFLSLTDSSGNPVEESLRQQKISLANELLIRIKNGEDMTDLVHVYSEDPDKEDNNGLFIIKNDSVYVEEFMDWALNANKGDVDIVESSIGLHIVKCEEIGGYDGAKEEIIEHLRIKKYNEMVEEEIKREEYKPVINKSVFDEIKSVPGDLDLSKNMG